MNRLLPILLTILLSMSLLLTGCGTGHSGPVDSDDANKEAQVVALPVEMAEARIGQVVALYSATATLQAEGEARVVPRLTGRVVELKVEEGDIVRAGQVLARLDDDRLRLEVARAEAELSRLRQDYNRHHEMHQRNLISTEAFERLKYELEAQQAQAELVRLELSWTAITAPIAGVVSERMIRVGNMVDTVQPVFVVTAMDRLEATLHVPEREMARLAAGQPTLLQVDALPGLRFEGRVARISPVIDASSGTFRVTVDVEDSSRRLRPGMFGRFHIVHDTREAALLVPVEAVLSEDGHQSVFVIDGDQVQRRAVVTGYRNNGDFEILEGLAPGDRVVVTGQNALRSGARVAVINAPVEDSAELDAEAPLKLAEDLGSREESA